MELAERIEFDPDTGLVPAVVQAEDGRVLMLAYMDRRALRRTLEEGRVTFWSRSRDELWEKGATSGNWLEALEVRADCDRDALLVRARPHGRACHTGEASCFDAGPGREVDADPGPPAAASGGGDAAAREAPGGPDGSGGAASSDAPGDRAGGGRRGAGLTAAAPSPAPVLASVMEELVAVVARRARERPEGSHTASLLEGGPAGAARKVGEEALEVVLSSVEEPARLAEESADLLYHLVVLWRAVGLPADAVGRELARRRGPPSGNGGVRAAPDPGPDAGEADPGPDAGHPGSGPGAEA